MVIGLVILGILIVLAFIVIGIYNRLISLKNRVRNAWSQIDVQLQRRYDLIPNLVETVKGYMEYEKGTLEAVVQARSQAMAARENIKESGGAPTGGAIKELMGAETALTGALGNIFALAENYPQLRASENMQQLQEELTSTENKVSFSRQSYNDQAMLYNTAQEQFPAALFAGMFGHKTADMYEVESLEAKKAVKVSFTS
ncbi:MAG: LemA family protein [Chlamydiota bacterium]|nr:LemA family protein [Chlamydiota bacterium]